MAGDPSEKDSSLQDATPIDEAQQRDTNGRPECFSSTTAEVLFIVAATMSVAMTSILTGGLAVITNKIGQDLNMTNAEVTWISASTSLAAGAFLLFFGRLADLFGRKSMFVVSLFLFGVFCLAAGFAKTGIAFDVLCGCLGVLSASSVPAAIGSMGAAYATPSKRKNYAFACFSAGNPLGFVFGSVASGICTQILSWRAYLYFMAIVYVIFAIIAFFVIPVDVSDKEPFNWSTLKTFDIVGTILTIAGFGLLSASLTLAGDAPQGWKTSYVIATLVVGVVLIIIFLYWETIAAAPLLPMWVWKDRDFSLLLLILFVGFGAFNAAAFFISLYIQRFRTSSSLLVAAYVLPMAIMGTIVNIVVGLVLHKVSNKLMMLFGTFCYAISFMLFGLNRDHSSYWYFLFWGFNICVWGADIQFNVANMYVMTSLPSSHQSTGGGIFQTVSRLSSTIILGISTAIFNAVQQNPPTSGYLGHQDMAPYSAVCFFAAAICGLSLICVPFLRVRTQGSATPPVKDAEQLSVKNEAATPVPATAVSIDPELKGI